MLTSRLQRRSLFCSTSPPSSSTPCTSAPSSSPSARTATTALPTGTHAAAACSPLAQTTASLCGRLWWACVRSGALLRLRLTAQCSDEASRGVVGVLNGPRAPADGGAAPLLLAAVTAVKFLPTHAPRTAAAVLAGAADGSLLMWRFDVARSAQDAALVYHGRPHARTVGCIAVHSAAVFATASVDGTTCIWRIERTDTAGDALALLQTLSLAPAFYPMCLAFVELAPAATVFAVAGTSRAIQVYFSETVFQCTPTDKDPPQTGDPVFRLTATLTGHEDWVRSLAFVRDGADAWLASASQDKYIRLWRIQANRAASSGAANGRLLGKLLSNKVYRLGSSQNTGETYSLTFEALLLGHEDWIHTATWRPGCTGRTLQLLSASEDNSAAVWHADAQSGIWVCGARLGELSAQKGSTTATGSTGGFLLGLWSADGGAVAALSRSGSWWLWTHAPDSDAWVPRVAATGHTQPVRDLAWLPSDPPALLSTGADQTTRLWAAWPRDTDGNTSGRDARRSWHEFARPQIHGYDLNCLAAVSPTRFVSGADEKLLRVFDEPKAVADLLYSVAGIAHTGSALLAASVPVLGLSNQAIRSGAAEPEDERREPDDDNDSGNATLSSDVPPLVHALPTTHPPLETHLARHALWPETDKLYGHGNEICAVAVRADGRVLASACRATALDHAVVRLWDTVSWAQLPGPPLRAHTSSVTALAFEPGANGRWLLSAGKDRQTVLWARSSHGQSSDQDGVASTPPDGRDPGPDSLKYRLGCAVPKAHSRMVLDVCWAPPLSHGSPGLSISPAEGKASDMFLTAGRDKLIKLWRINVGDPVSVEPTCMCDAAAAAVTCMAAGPAWRPSPHVNGAQDVSASTAKADTGAQAQALDVVFGTDAGAVGGLRFCVRQWSEVRGVDVAADGASASPPAHLGDGDGPSKRSAEDRKADGHGSGDAERKSTTQAARRDASDCAVSRLGDFAALRRARPISRLAWWASTPREQSCTQTAGDSGGGGSSSQRDLLAVAAEDGSVACWSVGPAGTDDV